MNLFLHVKLISDQLQFSPPLVISNATYTDIDNFSEATVVNTCLQAIDNSEKLLVYFDCQTNAELGSVMRLFNKMAQYKKPMKIVYTGDHPVMIKLLKRFGEKVETGGVGVAMGFIED
ncbi:MAG TPA: hypothetical protein PKL31_18025 [Fulvivirga sp.]|nr:hypothetical protein [Fulvivirga sp.]